MNADCVDGAQPSQFVSHSTARRHPARPACTHTSMVRVYGNFTCQLCHKRPSLGFVYLCHQDFAQGTAMWKISSNKRRKLQKPLGDMHKRTQSFSKQLESLGFSKSIILAAETGNYSTEQLELLKEQKRTVKRTIRLSIEDKDSWKWTNALQTAEVNDRLASESKANVDTRKGAGDKVDLDRGERRQKVKTQDVATAVKKTNQAMGSPTYPASLSKALEDCDFRVCHTCRPFFRDRCYIPFETALNAAFTPADRWIPQLMPVASAEVMKTIGLGNLKDVDDWHSSDFRDASSQIGGHTDDIDLQYQRLIHRPSSTGFRESLERDLESMMARDQVERSSTGLHSTTETNLNVKECNDSRSESFNLSLWKSLSDATLDQAAQVPLPQADGKDGLERVIGRFRGMGVTWPADNPILEEVGTEPEIVEGGLALTEEAFENQSPDIITSN